MKKEKTEPSIHKHLFDLLFQIKIRMKEIVNNVDKDLSPLHILILRLLVEEGEVSQANLVIKLEKDKSQITRLIQELEAKGLIIKEKSETDRRSFMLRPIKDVKKKVSYFIKQEQQMVEEMLSGISLNDRQIFDNTLREMQKNLRV